MRGDTIRDGDASQIPSCLEEIDQSIEPLFQLSRLSMSRTCVSEIGLRITHNEYVSGVLLTMVEQLSSSSGGAPGLCNLCSDVHTFGTWSQEHQTVANTLPLPPHTGNRHFPIWRLSDASSHSCWTARSPMLVNHSVLLHRRLRASLPLGFLLAQPAPFS